jgi:hypothetical protein
MSDKTAQAQEMHDGEVSERTTPTLEESSKTPPTPQLSTGQAILLIVTVTLAMMQNVGVIYLSAHECELTSWILHRARTLRRRPSRSRASAKRCTSPRAICSGSSLRTLSAP